MDEEQIGNILRREPAHDRRTAVFSALLAKQTGLGTEGMTVVGDSAIEIYTGGDYVSADIDLVVDSKSRVTSVLKGWGFRDEGKGWSKSEWNIFVDPMETRSTGSRRLTQVISTSQGSFRIIGVEDLIIRRVRESVAWQGREEAFAQAVLLARHAGSDIDWNYVEFYAQREGWEALLAEIRRRTSSANSDSMPT